MEQAASLRDFADKPLVVLTAGSGSDAARIAACGSRRATRRCMRVNDSWLVRGTADGKQPMQDRLDTLSTNNAHRVVDGAVHEALVADEEHAAATTQAVLDVAAAVRTARPLAS